MATTGNADDTTDRTLRIRFREGDDEGVEAALEALDRGESPDPTFEVVYHDPADVHRVTRPKSLELLRAIVQHDPGSIRETARLVDRDVSQVHRNPKRALERCFRLREPSLRALFVLVGVDGTILADFVDRLLACSLQLLYPFGVVEHVRECVVDVRNR